MADAARIGSLTDRPFQSSHNRHAGRKSGGPSFHDLLLRSSSSGRTAWSGRTTGAVAGVSNAVARVPAPRSATATPPTSSDGALDQAMTAEGVPPSWKDSLNFIMARESGGRVDARNPTHSARGLFQLTAANYHLNPHGAASFGHAVEEAQGGIRYIRERYGTADKAVQFWQSHHWY